MIYKDLRAEQRAVSACSSATNTLLMRTDSQTQHQMPKGKTIISFLSFLTCCFFVLCNFNANAVLDPTVYDATEVTTAVAIAGSTTDGRVATVAVADGIPTITIARAGSNYAGKTLYEQHFEIAYRAAYDIPANVSINAGDYNLPFKVVLSETAAQLTNINLDVFNGATGLISISCGNVPALSGVAVGSTVTNAFEGCTNLEEVKLGGITTPGTHFTGCTNIKTLELGCTTLPTDLLAALPKLESLKLAAGITELPANAFKNRTALKSVDLAGVTKVGAGAFQGCTALETVTLGTLTDVGADAFNGCEALSSSLTASLTALGARAFKGCADLAVTTLDISGLSAVPESAFEGCEKITAVTVGTSPVTIAASAFKGSGLTTIALTNVTSVGANAFENCASLATVTMPTSATVTLSKEAFKGCTSLAHFDLTKAAVSGVTEVPEGLFEGCTSLTQVVAPSATWPTEVTKIGARAFANCGFLGIQIPPCVKTIDAGAFSGCASVTGIEFLATPTLATIGAGAFQGLTGLNTELKIPASVTSIGANAFQGASSLEKVTIENSTSVVGLANANAFSGLKAGAVISVPDDLVDDYRAAAGWKDLSKTPGVVLASASASAATTSFVKFDSQGTCSGAEVGAVNNGAVYTSNNGNTLAAGAEVTITAVENDCCTFVNWTNSLGDVIAATDATTPLVLKAYASDYDITYYANFVPKTVVVAFAGGGGTVNGTTVFSGACGSTIELVATPESDKYTFLKWVSTDDGTDWEDVQSGDVATMEVAVDAGTQYRALFKVVPSVNNITVKNNGKVRLGKEDTTP